MFDRYSVLLFDALVRFTLEFHHRRKIRRNSLCCQYLDVYYSVERKTVAADDFEHCEAVFAVTDTCYVLHCSPSIRFLAISNISASFSIPMNSRFVWRQATPVVPLPIQQSRTVSPSSVYVRIRYSQSATGSALCAIRFACRHLRIVLRRLLVKHQYVFVAFERHLLCVKVSAPLPLYPYPFVTQEFFIACAE